MNGGVWSDNPTLVGLPEALEFSVWKDKEVAKFSKHPKHPKHIKRNKPKRYISVS